MRALVACVVLIIAGLQSAAAVVIVDFSPDTTGSPLGTDSFTNLFGTQIAGDRFTLATGATLTGGAIFSNSNPAVGTGARFLIFADAAGTPAAAPTIDIATMLDAVDGLLTTTQSSLSRKHATIAPTFLAAGTYWFSMPANQASSYGQALTTVAGGYDDGSFRFGATSLTTVLPPVPFPDHGDMFFTLEALASLPAAPEPATLALMALGLAGLGFSRRKRVV